MRDGALDLSRVRHVVLDEADEMLKMGFAEDVEGLLSQVGRAAGPRDLLSGPSRTRLGDEAEAPLSAGTL